MKQATGKAVTRDLQRRPAFVAHDVGPSRTQRVEERSERTPAKRLLAIEDHRPLREQRHRCQETKRRSREPRVHLRPPRHRPARGTGHLRIASDVLDTGTEGTKPRRHRHCVVALEQTAEHAPALRQGGDHEQPIGQALGGRRVERAGPAARDVRLDTQFVELFAAPAGTSAGMRECVVELENARGAKMRVELSGNGLAGLAGMCSTFWSAA